MTDLPLAATQPLDSAPPETHSEMRYVARQPILNLTGKVQGYELLFRQKPSSGFGEESKQATRAIFDDTLSIGLEPLTGNLPAFIHCTEESILEHLVEVLPPSRTVLEIDASLDFSRDLPAACRHLKSRGYHLALDNFIWDSLLEPMVHIADYIKIDFQQCNPAVRRDLMGLFRHAPAQLVATGIETPDAQSQARKEGFTLFQGFYFCFPEPLRHARIPSNRQSHFQLLQLLYRDPLDLKKVVPLVKRDANLSYRLLCLANSPALAVHQEISSLEGAILFIGESAFRRIASVAILTEINSGRPPEILRMTLLRARFCELAAPLRSLDPEEQYLLGMLSLLPAMLRIPMETLASQLPLRHEIHQALLGQETPERWLLQWIEFWEKGRWEECDAMAQKTELPQQQLVQCYQMALSWDGNPQSITD